MPFRCDVHKRRSARAAIEKLVATPHRKVYIVTDKVKRNGSCRMRKIPQRERTAGVRRRSDRRHVEHGAGAIVDVRQADDRNIGAERTGDLGRGNPPDGGPELRSDGVNDVAVGRKVAQLRHDDRTAGPKPQRGDEHLIELHRRRVADDDVAGRSSDQLADAIADTIRGGHPPVRVPRADQVGAPLAFDDVTEPISDAPGHRSERVPVEVDDAVGKDEPLAELGERVSKVERDRIVPVHVERLDQL
jgi:hypothetical protein